MYCSCGSMALAPSPLITDGMPLASSTACAIRAVASPEYVRITTGEFVTLLQEIRAAAGFRYGEADADSPAAARQG